MSSLPAAPDYPPSVGLFEVGEQDFLLNGRPQRILAGAVHYFRVHPDQWADRVRKARAMGLNTIETYVAWNAHEPRRGEWDVEGSNDLAAFLDVVAAEGMFAIVRPGPYICAEWHNGGLPVWLTRMPGVRIRSSEQTYLAEVTRYLERVYDIVAPRQISRGGNIILVQIENEYGAYGDDKDYLRALVDLTRRAGIDIPLTTVDQPEPDMLRNGGLDDVLRTASFGSRATERLATLREHQPTGPLMVMEFWDGWFDAWGEDHHTTDAAASAADLKAVLASGASANIYMFHGGTNFGLTNGANLQGRYAAIVTSYDYDAPLDEAGYPTEKYHAFRDVIAQFATVPTGAGSERRASETFAVVLETTGDWTNVTTGDPSVGPLVSFDEAGFAGAVGLYRAQLPPAAHPVELAVGEVRDHAWVSVDGRRVGKMARADDLRTIEVPPGGRLDVLIEDQGRVNYGPHIGETKGLIGPVTVAGSELDSWSFVPFDVAALAAAHGDPERSGMPAAPQDGSVALRSTFTLDGPGDLFLDTAGLTRGYAFVNGFFLGRYSAIGPQRTLYVPGPVTRAAANSLVILELEGTTATTVQFVAGPDLGPEIVYTA